MAQAQPQIHQNNRNPNIEFIIKPKEDLVLEGPVRKIPRVSQGLPYPCQMQKSQNFSCLFRHYAKHNGLRKEDLVFYFVDKLLPEQTPEMVHLMPQDEIWVEHRVNEDKNQIQEPVDASGTTFSEHFRELFLSSAHADVTFLVGEDEVAIKAHRAVLSARSVYFKAMFREDNMMIENRNGIIRTPHEPTLFHKLLEFIYTDTIKDLDTCFSEEIVELIILANEYVLDDLRIRCERYSPRILTLHNIGKLLLLSNQHNASLLKIECGKFVTTNKELLASDVNFRQEIEANPELGLILFELTLEKIPENVFGFEKSNDTYISDGDNPDSDHNKRRRISHDHTSEIDSDNPAVPSNNNQHMQVIIGNSSTSSSSSNPGIHTTYSSTDNNNNNNNTTSLVMNENPTTSIVTSTVPLSNGNNMI